MMKGIAKRYENSFHNVVSHPNQYGNTYEEPTMNHTATGDLGYIQADYILMIYDPIEPLICH